MDKANVLKTQEMWKDYPNVEYWLKTISEPAKHMIIRENEIIAVDTDYERAVESLSYILLGEQKLVSLTKNEHGIQENEMDIPTIDDLCKILENKGETELSDQLKNAAMFSRLLNPLLDVSLPEEMHDKLTICRTPGISQCIIFDSIEDVFNNKENYEMAIQNIHDKEYFENVALEYLRALPLSMTYYEAKHNIRENMEKLEQYPLLQYVLIRMNLVEAIRIGLDLIGSKVSLRYQMTVADVLSQLSGGDKDA